LVRWRERSTSARSPVPRNGEITSKSAAVPLLRTNSDAAAHQVGRAGLRARARVHEDQRAHPLGRAQRVPHRHDAAHRVPQQVEPLEAEAVEEAGHVGDELVEVVGRGVGRFGLSP